MRGTRTDGQPVYDNLSVSINGGLCFALNERLMSDGIPYTRTPHTGGGVVDGFPEHSPVHDQDNAGRVFLLDVVGRVVNDIYEAIQDQSTSMTIDHATKDDLDLLGDWFGVPRDNLPDTRYRERIILKLQTEATPEGIINVVANMVGLPTTSITLTDGTVDCVTTRTPVVDRYSASIDTPFTSYTNRDNGIVTIQIPTGTDTTILESYLERITAAGVWLIIEEV